MTKRGLALRLAVGGGDDAGLFDVGGLSLAYLVPNIEAIHAGTFQSPNDFWEIIKLLGGKLEPFFGFENNQREGN